MSARTIGCYRKPVTLFLLKQVAADKADAKSGELVIEGRARDIPTSYDDIQIGKWQRMFQRQKDYWSNNAFDTRQKITRLEHRRMARKFALSRKFYQFIDSPSDPGFNWED
jgi:hypothetical protein